MNWLYCTPQRRLGGQLLGQSRTHACVNTADIATATNVDRVSIALYGAPAPPTTGLDLYHRLFRHGLGVDGLLSDDNDACKIMFGWTKGKFNGKGVDTTLTTPSK